MRKIGISVFAALGAWLGLGLLASPAQAQICGDLFDECEIAGDVLGDNREAFCGFFPLDANTCESMAKKMFKQCETAVKNATKCWKAYFSGFPKTAKPACKTEGDASGDCNDNFKEDATEGKDEADIAQDDEIACCEDAALDFFDDCVDGCL